MCLPASPKAQVAIASASFFLVQVLLFEAVLNMLRLRKNTLKVVKELDAFPKVPESYVKTSKSGGSGRTM